MVTENGTIKVRTIIDENLQKEFSVNSNRIALAMLIAGAVGTALFLALYIATEFIAFGDDSLFIILGFVFAVFLAGGIFLKIFLKKALQQVRNSPKVNEYEFCVDSFNVSQISNGEVVATVKIYNSQITNVKNGKNYFYLFVNRTQVYPVGKSDFTEDELNTFKTVFRIGNSLR